MTQSITYYSRGFCLSASVLAIVAASPALAQTTVLTPTSSNYDLMTHAGTDTVVELSPGTSGYFIEGDSHDSSQSGNPYAPVPAGGVGIFATAYTGWWQPSIGSSDSQSWGSSWFLAKTNAPVIKVDSGATLTFVGAETYGGTAGSAYDPGNFYFYSMVQATGDVTFGAEHWTFWGTNSFNNVTLLDNATLRSGGTVEAWGSNAGPANNTISGWLAGSSTSVFEVGSGSFIANVNSVSAAHPFLGTIKIDSGATLVVGDSTHSGAAIGGTGARISLPTSSSVLSGYGTVYGNVDSYGIIKAGGTDGVLGTLTINGNLTQHSTGQVYANLTPTGASTIVVNGTAVIDGELVVSVAAGTYGNGVYQLLTATSLSGKFSTVSLSGNTSGAILGALATSSGYVIVTEKGTSGQVYGHLDYANRTALTNFVGSLYDVMTMTPTSGAVVDTWITPIGQIENLSRDGQGYEQKTYGLSAGAMHRFERHGGVIGGAFSYRHGNMSIKADTATASSNGYDLAVFGGAEVNTVRFDGSIFYNVYDADTARPMGTYGTSKANNSGFAMGASGQISRDLFHGWSTPYVRAMYARTHLGAASESGSLQYDLAHDAINHNTFVVDVGARVHLLRPQPDLKLKIDADLAWRYDLSDPGETVSMTYANFAGGTNVAYWRGDSQNTLRIGLNAAGDITDKLEIYGRLDGALTSHRRAGELAAGVKYRF